MGGGGMQVSEGYQDDAEADDQTHKACFSPSLPPIAPPPSPLLAQVTWAGACLKASPAASWAATWCSPAGPRTRLCCPAGRMCVARCRGGGSGGKGATSQSCREECASGPTGGALLAAGEGGDAGQRHGRAVVPGVYLTVWCDQIGNRTIRCDWIGLRRLNLIPLRVCAVTCSALNKCAPTPPSSLVRRLSRSPSRVRLLARR